MLWPRASRSVRQAAAIADIRPLRAAHTIERDPPRGLQEDRRVDCIHASMLPSKRFFVVHQLVTADASAQVSLDHLPRPVAKTRRSTRIDSDAAFNVRHQQLKVGRDLWPAIDISDVAEALKTDEWSGRVPTGVRVGVLDCFFNVSGVLGAISPMKVDCEESRAHGG